MNNKTLELIIKLNVAKAQTAAIVSVLSTDQQKQYLEKMNYFKEEFIKNNNITDEHLLKVLDEEYQ